MMEVNISHPTPLPEPIDEVEWDISLPTLLPPIDMSFRKGKEKEDRPKVSPTALAFPYNSPTSYSPTRSREKSYQRVFKLPRYADEEERSRYAGVALDYFNKKNGTNYKLVCAFPCNHTWDRNQGIWVHCNFRAKQDVDGKQSLKLFFAEILGDNPFNSSREELTMTITACFILEGRSTANCNFCHSVHHPPNGFLKGHNKALPTSPLDSPTSLIYGKETLSDSSSTFTFVSDEEWSEELHRRADISLKYYNEKNGTAYELVDVVESNGILWDGFWMHVNFTAKQPNDAIDGESSSKLFFAEILGVVLSWTHNAENVIWTASACHILLDGKTIDGCIFCSNIIHPTHGFSQGITRAQTNKYSRGYKISCDLSYAEKRDRRAEYALETYNRENGTNYELLDVIIHSAFESNGTWSHYNFVAKQDIDGKYTRNIFFAEIMIMHNHPTEFLVATACLILDDKITAGCSLCSDVIHPTCGYLKGLDELSPSYLPETSPSYLPETSPSRETDRCSINTGPFVFTSDETWSHELNRRANIAMHCYNKENGTNYEVVDVSKNKDIFWDGFWMHINFTARPTKGDIEEEKLFFAEVCGVYDTPGDVNWTWKSTACHILDGKTTSGCTFCSGIIHPTHGFCQGISRPSQPGNLVSSHLPSNEKRCRRAEIAIEYYNKSNGTDYELLYVVLSNGFSSDGAWYHCNFVAKQDEDGKYCRKYFFAEILVDYHNPMLETLRVTACHILEDGKTTSSCGLCSDVIHPHQEFLKGYGLCSDVIHPHQEFLKGYHQWPVWSLD